MNIKNLLPGNLDILLKEFSKDSIFADVYVERSETFRLVLEPERIEELHWGEEAGINFRKINPDFETLAKFTSVLNAKLLEEFVKNKDFSGFVETEKAISLKKEAEKKEIFNKRFEFLKKLEEEIRKKFRSLRHYQIGLTEKKKEVFILNSDGKVIEEERFYIRIGGVVVVEKDGRLERGYEVKGLCLPFEKAVKIKEFREIPERACRLAEIMLKAKRAPAGVMPVILSGEAGGTMIHEAVGHGLEADHAEEGLSVYSGKLGEKVASSLITVVDDATLPELYGSYRFDDEGTPAQKVVLIEKGILKNFLYDKRTALKYGKQSNGHGRRQDFRKIPIPRMGNTYIEKGFHKPEEILKSIDKGLLVKKMGGGEVNPLTGDFVFEVREGYFIEKGEVAYPVKGATLVGNGPKVLEIIDMVGDDLCFEAGICGKDGQSVPVSDGQPTIRIPEITVGGVL